ncbi:MAG: hypothetical protein LW822_08850, partial [Phycisphaeraceae bacterium]|nr:hypothetical protein [Phycisphaeraceae bacterium]
MSEARGKAHVHVVIIGFASFPPASPYLVDYDPGTEHATTHVVKGISPYLTDGGDLIVEKATKPLSNMPIMRCG